MGEAIFLRRVKTRIKDISAAVITLAAGTLTYNGAAQTKGVSSVVLDGKTLIAGTDYTISGNSATNAGTHTITITGVGKYAGTVTAQWSIAKLSLTKPTVSGSYTYNGSTRSATISNYNSTYMSQSGTASTATAGSYTLTFALKDKNNTQWADGTTGNVTGTWAIAKLSLTKPTISGSFTYDGNSKSCTVSGMNSSYITQGGTTSATDAGTYTVTFALKDTANTQWSDGTTAAVSRTWSIAQAAGSISVSPTTLGIIGPAGTTGQAVITYTGDGSISVKSSATSKATVSRSGTTITVKSVAAGSATITITLAAGTNYTGASCTIAVTVKIPSVFGVMWNYAKSSTALTRLTASSDPNGYVDVSVSSEPTAAVGTSGGSSPFDSYMPWKGMIKYNASASGAVSTWTSNSNDTVVYIPEFYCKIVDDTTNSKLYIYVSGASKSGFTKHPGSNRYVGRYHTGSGYVTKTGLAPLVSITRATARSGSSAKGSKWYQYDFATYSAICLLYIVEWANWNSQSKIGLGYTSNNSAAINSGGTDSMTYHTGRASGTNGKTAVQYRWIENLWGNTMQWVDGFGAAGRNTYVCTSPAKFTDNDFAANYTATGVMLPSGDNSYIRGMSPGNLDWCLIPDADGGGSSTYVPDTKSASDGSRILRVGGFWGSTTSAGLFMFSCSADSSGTYNHSGSRLMIVP